MFKKLFNTTGVGTQVPRSQKAEVAELSGAESWSLQQISRGSNLAGFDRPSLLTISTKAADRPRVQGEVRNGKYLMIKPAGNADANKEDLLAITANLNKGEFVSSYPADNPANAAGAEESNTRDWSSQNLSNTKDRAAGAKLLCIKGEGDVIAIPIGAWYKGVPESGVGGEGFYEASAAAVLAVHVNNGGSAEQVLAICASLDELERPSHERKASTDAEQKVELGLAEDAALTALNVRAAERSARLDKEFHDPLAPTGMD